MDEEFSIPDWNPLVVYIDCWNFSTTHNPVQWLKKSIKALADWFIARREIKSILLVPVNNLSNLMNVDAATAVKDTLNFAMLSDPIYGKGNHWLMDKIMVANVLELTGINYHEKWETMLHNFLPPDIILTGRYSDEWISKNAALASSCPNTTILFDRYGKTESVENLYWESLPEYERLSRLFG
jgi:hypothetical protein